MLFGYVFNITIVSAFVNVFLSLKLVQVENYFGAVLIPLAAVMLMQPVTDALKLRARSQDEMKKYNVTASAVPFFVYFSLMLVYMRKMVVLAAEMQAKAAEYEAANPYASGGYETKIFIDILTEKVTALRDLLIPWVIPVILVCFAVDYIVVRYAAGRSDWS